MTLNWLAAHLRAPQRPLPEHEPAPGRTDRAPWVTTAAPLTLSPHDWPTVKFPPLARNLPKGSSMAWAIPLSRVPPQQPAVGTNGWFSGNLTSRHPGADG